MEEQFFQCPYCWENISMLIDVSIPKQTYIEDCEICCNPIELTVIAEQQNIVSLNTKSIEQ